MDYLEKFFGYDENANRISEEIYENIFTYMQSNNIEEKEALEKALQIACFCIYLSKTNLISDYNKTYLMSVIANNSIKDLYIDFNNLFKYVDDEVKKILKESMGVLAIVIPEKKSNSEKLKVEILENLKFIRAY